MLNSYRTLKIPTAYSVSKNTILCTGPSLYGKVDVNSGEPTHVKVRGMERRDQDPPREA